MNPEEQNTNNPYPQQPQNFDGNSPVPEQNYQHYPQQPQQPHNQQGYPQEYPQAGAQQQPYPAQPQQPYNQQPLSQQPQAYQQPQTLPFEQPRQATQRPAIPDPEPSTISTSGIPDFSNSDSIKASIPPSKGWNSFKGLVSVAELFGGALLLALLINSFVFQSYQVFGRSMESTLQEGNRLIISKVGKSISNALGNEYLPSRNEVIVFQNPRNSSIQLVKRVIGLPGERVVVEDGSIRVYNTDNPDGFNPDEGQAYRPDLPEYTDGFIDVTVPAGEIFVSGDNRTGGNSLDSRNDLGTVPLDNVVGELWVRIFPLSDARFF